MKASKSHATIARWRKTAIIWTVYHLTRILLGKKQGPTIYTTYFYAGVFALFCFTQHSTMAGSLCSFNTNGSSLYKCSSKIEVTVVIESFLSGDTVFLTFPNTFDISDTLDCTVYSSTAFSDSSLAIFSAGLSSGGLRRFIIIPENDTCRLVLNYLACNRYDNHPANFTHLYFDCEVYHSNTANTLPSVLHSNNLMSNFNSEFLQATSSVSLSMIIDAPQSYIDHDTTDCRTSNIYFSNMEMDSIRLKISNGNTIISHDLTMVGDSSDFILSTGNFGCDTSFSLSFLQNNHYIHVGTLNNYIQIKQCLEPECPMPVPSSRIPPKIEVGPLCSSCDSPLINQVWLNNAQSFAVTNYESVTIHRADSDTNFCNGSYFYDITIHFTGAPLRFENFIFPVDTSIFKIQALQIQLDTGVFSTIDTAYYDLLPALYSGYNNLNYGQLFTLVKVKMESLNYSSDSLDGFDGPYLPLHQGRTITLRLEVLYHCPSSNTCQNPTIRLTPEANRIRINANTECDQNPIGFRSIPSIQTAPFFQQMFQGMSYPFPATQGDSSILIFNINTNQSNPFILRRNTSIEMDCDSLRYFAELNITQPSGFSFDSNYQPQCFLNNQPVTASIGSGSLRIDIPGSALVSQAELYVVLHNMPCPDPIAGSGFFHYQLVVKAVCADCSDTCSLPIACSDVSSYVHCNSPCSTRVGTLGMQMQRCTYGWATPEDFITGAPIQTAQFFDQLPPIPRMIQLSRFYPYDIMEVKAKGEVNPDPNAEHSQLGFQFQYNEIPGLDPDFMSLQENTLALIKLNSVDTIFISLPQMQLSSPTTLQLAGANGNMFARYLFWPDSLLRNAGVYIDSFYYAVNLIAKLRMKPDTSTPPGTYPVFMRNQFVCINHSGNIDTSFSCDPMGSSLNLLVPKTDYYQTPASIANSWTFPGYTSPDTSNTVTPHWCNYNFALGIKHRGGLGSLVDDFPYEFRPLSSWPPGITSNAISEVHEIYSGPNMFIANGNLFSNSQTGHPLLPARERSENNEWQGLRFSASRTCANNRDTIILPLQIKTFAYLHNGHMLDTIPGALIPNPFTNILPLNGPLHIQGFDSLAQTQNLNGNNYNMTISPNFPSTAHMPFIFRFTPDASASVIQVLVANQSPNSSGWYVYPNGLPFSSNMINNFSLNINTQCYDSIFSLHFEYRSFCDTIQLRNFLDSNQTECNYHYRNYQKFRRAQGSPDNLQLTNSFSSDTCNLFWHLKIINPASRPPLVLSNLRLNFSTGLIFESATLHQIGNSVSSMPLTNPSFSFVQQNAPSVNYIEASLLADSINMAPGDTLSYVLAFRLESYICNTYNGGSILSASIQVQNTCQEVIHVNPITINNSNLSQHINQIIAAPDTGCCMIVPLYIRSFCDTLHGYVSFHNTFSDTVRLITYHDNSQQDVSIPADSIGMLPITTTGIHGIVVYNPAINWFYARVENFQDNSFTSSVFGNLNICNGDSTLLTANQILTQPFSDDTLFTYFWSTSQTDSNIMVAPTEDSVYTVIVSNNNCSDTASIAIQVIQPAIVNATANPITLLAAGDSTTLIAHANSPNCSFEWTGDGNTYTGDTITLAPAHSTPFVVRASCDSLCTIFDTVMVYVCPDFEVKDAVNGFLPDVLICEPGTVTLGIPGMVNPVSGYVFSWTLGTSLVGTEMMQQVTVLAHSTYQLRIRSLVSGCEQVVQQRVYVGTQFTNALSGSNNFASCDSTETYSSAPGTVLHVLSVNGVAYADVVGSNPGAIVSDTLQTNIVHFNWQLLNQLFGGTVIFIIENACVKFQVEKEVNPCCAAMQTYTNYTADQLLAAIGSGNTISNQHLVLAGNTSIDTDIHFVNCHIAMGADALIVNTNPWDASFIASDIRACFYLWKGIDFSDGQIFLDQTRLSDAKTGIKIKNLADVAIKDSKLFYNETDLAVFDISALNNPNFFNVKGSVFTGRYMLAPLQPTFPPAISMPTKYNVFIKNVPATLPLVLGDSTDVNMRNYFSVNYKRPCSENNSNPACFAPATSCVNIINASVRFVNNEFGKANFGVRAGIDANPDTFRLTFGQVPSTQVATPPSTYQNSFSDCSYSALRVYKNFTLSIRDNTFENCLRGIDVRNNPNSNLTIEKNKIEGAFAQGISVTNMAENVLINQNIIHCTDSITYGNNAMGIYVTKINQSSPLKQTMINENLITGVNHGIKLEGICDFITYSNRIRIKNSLYAPCPINTGVWLEHSINGSVSGNIVNATSGNFYLEGFRVDNSPGITLCSNQAAEANTQYRMGDAFLFLGNSGSPNGFYDNHMSHCFRGLYLGGNPTPMGQQGMVDKASANTWWDVSFKHTYYDPPVIGLNNLIFNPQTGSNVFGEYYPNPYNFYPFYGNIINTTIPNPDSLYCYFSGTPPEATSLRMEYLNDIAKDSAKTVGNSAIIKYNMKENLQLLLQSDSTLLSNYEMAQFSDSVDMVNMGKIIEVKNVYLPNMSTQDSINFVQKTQGIAQGWLTPEQLNKEVLVLLSQNVSLKDSVYSSQTLGRLRQIAGMCPYTKGSGVHLARKILSGINPKDNNYLNACEMQTDQNGMRIAPLEQEDEEEFSKMVQEPLEKNFVRFAIKPNPNNGICKIEFPLQQISRVELYGVEGKYIQVLPVSNDGVLDLQPQAKGAYVLKLIEKNGNVQSSKLIKY